MIWIAPAVGTTSVPKLKVSVVPLWVKNAGFESVNGLFELVAPGGKLTVSEPGTYSSPLASVSVKTKLLVVPTGAAAVIRNVAVPRTGV